MYEGPSAQSEVTTEEYLLGKIFKSKDSGVNEVKEIGNHSPSSSPFSSLIIYDFILAKQPGSLWVNKPSSKNDLFTKLHEDPMLMIKKNEKEVSCSVNFFVLFFN